MNEVKVVTATEVDAACQTNGANGGAADHAPEALHLLVDNVHCAGCIKRIESNLSGMPGVTAARVNLSTKRLLVHWQPEETTPEAITNTVTELGFPARPFDPATVEDAAAAEEKKLLQAMAVAGFAAANVMLLSVSVWSGHFSGMGEATRTLFHWLSAIIALPAVAYAGLPFFRSAARALKAMSLNMDVPISLAVVLASAVSLQQTMKGAEHAYFDASVSLLFFLLVGRYLDHRARAKARSAATRLLGLRSERATVIDPDGTRREIAADDIMVGMLVAVAAGDRLAADGFVVDGETEIDTSLVTGESIPSSAAPGAEVHAGTLNLTTPVTMQVTAAGEDTLLAEIVRLMEAAEQGRAKYVRLADRAAKLYSPLVHILAGGTFLGWLAVGIGWEQSLLISVAVLIITCPCALGLAVPTVQVVASDKLLSQGVLLKAADGLERLADVDHIVFDKTGTLTMGKASLLNADQIDSKILALAANLAAHSHHPLSRALAALTSDGSPVHLTEISETPGKGLSANHDGKLIRLGRRDWCGIDEGAKTNSASALDAVGPEIWLSQEGALPYRFVFADALRPDAKETIDRLRGMGLSIELLSGDRKDVVRIVADQLEISDWRAECPPDAKVARLKELTQNGQRVLMVGDGLNDAPALATGHASMSPATAADISQAAADLVFQGERLAPVATAVATARAATRHVKQNFVLAIGYNLIAVPIAVAGFATPLIAAVAMSSSSILVTLNALRLKLVK